MSTSTESELLPLPETPMCIKDDSELLKIWETIDGWYSKVKEATNKKHRKYQWQAYGCHILLGCEVLHERLEALAKDQNDQNDVSALNSTLQHVQVVHKWVEAIGSVHEDFRWEPKTVYQVAHEKALELYNYVHTQATKTVAPSKLPISFEEIRGCELVLYVVKLYTGSDLDVPRLDKESANERWEFIDSLLKAQQKLLAATAVNEDKLLFNEAESHLLALYGRGTIAVETPGILKPNEAPSLEEVIVLLRGQWICDRVIACYLTLVCHQANGHFNLQDPCAKQPGSPKYFVWDDVTVNRLRQRKSMGRAWPPFWYPKASLKDVEIQFFPWNIEGKHWCLGVLSKVEGSWVLDQYSTLPGYEASMQESWDALRGYLELVSDGAINALTIEVRYPSSPQQHNGGNSGPFILCIARWLMEGWPLRHIKTGDMSVHRKRIAFELERRSLTRGSLSP